MKPRWSWRGAAASAGHRRATVAQLDGIARTGEMASMAGWKLLFAVVALILAPGGVLGGPVLFYANTPTQQMAKCVRTTVPPAGSTVNSPIKDLTAQDLMCGWGATTPGTQVCNANAGETINLVFGNMQPGDNILATADVGTCEVYMQQTASPQTAPTAAGWFKVFENTFTSADGWCSVKLIANGGILSVPLPSTLPTGSYKLRAEISSVRTADVLFTANPQRGIQFSVFCIDLTVAKGAGAAASFAPTVNIPGYLTGTSAGVVYDVKTGHGANNLMVGWDYPNPFGPPVATITPTAGGTGGMPTPPPVAGAPVLIPMTDATTGVLNPLDAPPNVLPLPVQVQAPAPAPPVIPAPSYAAPVPSPPMMSPVMGATQTTTLAGGPASSPSSIPAAMPSSSIMSRTTMQTGAPPAMATVAAGSVWNLWNDTVWTGIGLCNPKNLTTGSTAFTGSCGIPFFADELVVALVCGIVSTLAYHFVSDVLLVSRSAEMAHNLDTNLK
ncbi:hypothetical protein HDU93_008779 [Gonapodya sp. JEL0774]|nr:hypothetical protein HDU93_008779 [Gonapodya sp. JEL0774]